MTCRHDRTECGLFLYLPSAPQGTRETDAGPVENLPGPVISGHNHPAGTEERRPRRRAALIPQGLVFLEAAPLRC
eukprot:592777-Hanusia_phi.AAC.1